MPSGIGKQDTIMTTGKRAWHGKDINQDRIEHDELGEKVFNFQIYEAPHIITVNNNAYPTDMKTIYRLGEGDEIIALGEVGKDYEPLKCTEIVEMNRPISDSGMVKIATAGTLFNGVKRFITWQLEEFEPVAGDHHVFYLMFFDSTDGTTGVGYCRTIVRTVCNNTFTEALTKESSSILRTKHRQNVKANLERIQDAINLVRLEFNVTKEQLQALSKIVIGGEDAVRKAVKLIFSTESLEETLTTIDITRKGRIDDTILSLYDGGVGQDIRGVRGTGLGLFNAITEFTNHYRGADRTKNPSTGESRKSEVLFGTAKTINNRAMKVILGMR